MAEVAEGLGLGRTQRRRAAPGARARTAEDVDLARVAEPGATVARLADREQRAVRAQGKCVLVLRGRGAEERGDGGALDVRLLSPVAADAPEDIDGAGARGAVVR